MPRNPKAKKQSRATKHTASPALLSQAEIEFGNLASKFNDAQSGCMRLANDGRIDRATQDGYWTLSQACLVTLMRFDKAWTFVVDKTPLDEIERHRDFAAAASDAVDKAIGKPTTDNLFEAYGQVGFANDQVASLLDRAMAGD